jgi:hypothetical protein
MARYYNERLPKDDDCFWDSGLAEKSKAQMVLRPELWHGQQHGDGNAEVHARHMRPLCDAISSCESLNPLQFYISPTKPAVTNYLLQAQRDHQI